MDGTLIDTEKYYRIFWPKALAHFGYEMSDEQALSMRSLGQPYAPQHLKDIWIMQQFANTGKKLWKNALMKMELKSNRVYLHCLTF